VTGATTLDLASRTPESLRSLARELPRKDPAAAASLLAAHVCRLREPFAPHSAREFVDAALAVCRELYGHGRLAETLPLVRALREQCLRAGERDQARRATFLCGIASADSADLVGAIGHYVEALRMAAGEENRVEMARTWGNIGAAFAVSGRKELAARCYWRCLNLLEPLPQPSITRFGAHANLANCLLHLGDNAEGIRHGRMALRELDGVPDADPYDVILVHRNLARLLIAENLTAEADEHVAQAVVLARACPSPRASIAADMALAAHELAVGNADLALTRIDRTLARAREVPATLHDALANAVRAEDAAGYPARALLRLQELSSHLYGHAVERTRRVIELAGIDPAEPEAEYQRELERGRLESQLAPPAPPNAWATWRRLGASAVLGMDPTGAHGVRVGAFVKALALARGCPPLQALELGLASELHDIGLSSVPAAVLGKPGPWNDAERALGQRHSEAGAAMLMDDPHPRLLLARDIARYHHARWDGRGCPDRVAGEAIPLGARMCAIADAYDAMVLGLGRPPVAMTDALAELRRCAGQQFDPELVSCFDAVVNGELEALGLDPAANGMETFQELVSALREDRGFV
jgi:putative two-component system response regulator